MSLEDWKRMPLEARLALVREARLTFGASFARSLWSDLNLPKSDKADQGDFVPPDRASDLLKVLLEGEFDGNTVADLIDHSVHQVLEQAGIRLQNEDDDHALGVWVAFGHPAIKEVMKGHRNFWIAWRDMPGAQSKRMKFCGKTWNAVLVPLA